MVTWPLQTAVHRRLYRTGIRRNSLVVVVARLTCSVASSHMMVVGETRSPPGRSAVMDDNSEGCGCSFVLYLTFGLWAVCSAVRATTAFIKGVEQVFCSLVKGAESWWVSLVYTPYFHLVSVTVGSVAIGFMIGWAVAFRTRLPKRAVRDEGQPMDS